MTDAKILKQHYLGINFVQNVLVKELRIKKQQKLLFELVIEKQQEVLREANLIINLKRKQRRILFSIKHFHKSF